MNEIDVYGLQQGYWEQIDNIFESKGNYINGLREGIWVYKNIHNNKIFRQNLNNGRVISELLIETSCGLPIHDEYRIFYPNTKYIHKEECYG